LKIHFSYVVPQKDGFVKALRPVPFEEASFRYYCGFTKHDGFVKSPYAVLPFFPRHCGVPSVRLIPRDSGALPMELFTLPFEEVLNRPFYEFVKHGTIR